MLDNTFLDLAATLWHYFMDDVIELPGTCIGNSIVWSEIWELLALRVQLIPKLHCKPRYYKLIIRLG